MRTIKFRVFTGKEMRYPKESGLTFKNGSFHQINLSDTFLKETEVAQMSIMQFTGSVDSNGKEIYEGDVVELEEGFHPRFRPIVFTEYGSWYIGECGISFGQMKANGFVHCKVVGNIHENPELIKN